MLSGSLIAKIILNELPYFFHPSDVIHLSYVRRTAEIELKIRPILQEEGVLHASFFGSFAVAKLLHKVMLICSLNFLEKLIC